MTTTAPRQKPQDVRLAALRRFAVGITLFNVIGISGLGFEQSWAQLLVALATAYSLELLIQVVMAWSYRTRPRFRGNGVRGLVDFLLPAHIAALSTNMLLFANDRLWIVAFAVAVMIGSKAVIRIPFGRGSRHFLNPSNVAISVTLLTFPWVGIVPPYQFTENVFGGADWALFGIIVAAGSFLNGRFTRKIPLILGWVGGFVLQALVRSWLFETSILGALLPMTGIVFLLYTFYMITDPGTTPFDPTRQVLFGGAVAAVYGLLMALHIVFGLFFALTIVCALRGFGLYLHELGIEQAMVETFARARQRAQESAVMRRLG